MPHGDEHSSHQANLPQYPNRYLLAVIDSGQESDAAARALQAAGFAPEDVSVLHGPEGLKAGQAQEQAGGLLVQFMRAFLDIEGGVVRQRFQDALRGGASDVFVHLRSSDQQQQAEAILRQHQAYLLTVLGPFTWEALPSS